MNTRLKDEIDLIIIVDGLNNTTNLVEWPN